MFGLMYLLQACLIDGINELLIELKVGGGFTVYEYDLLGFGFSVFGLYLGVVFGSARSVLADLQQTAGPSAWYPKPEAEMATFYSEVRSPLCITCIQAHVLTTSIRACVMPHRTADFALKAQVHRSVSAPTPSITQLIFRTQFFPSSLQLRAARAGLDRWPPHQPLRHQPVQPPTGNSLFCQLHAASVCVHLPLPQLPFLQCATRRPPPCKRAAQGTAVTVRWSHVTLLTHVLQTLHAQLAAVVIAFASLLSLS